MKRKRYKYFKTFHRVGLEYTLRQISQKFKSFERIIQIGAGEDGLCEKFNYNEKVTLDIDKKLSPDYIRDIALDELSDIGKFDAIFCLEVLEHVEDIDSALQKLKHLARSKSLFFFSLPFCFHIHGDPNDFRRYTSEGFNYLLTKNGFSLTDYYPFGGYISCIFDLVLFAPYLKFLFFPLRIFTFILNVFLPDSSKCPSGYVFVAKLND